jgi:coenzyme F420-reducing hydrogenase beta subunit
MEVSKTYFSKIEDAIEEAEWLANTYVVPHVLSWEKGKYTVFTKDSLKKEVVLEIFNPLAPAVRCRNCGFIDERGADISIIQGPGGVQGFSEEARGDSL